MGKLPNRAFLEMQKVAVDRLTGRDPGDIASKANVSFDREESRFVLPSLGKVITVRYPDYEMKPDIQQWHQLVILHYLDLADGTPLSDREITFGQLRDGLVRGSDFDRRAEAAIRRLGQRPEAQIRSLCAGLGASFIPSKADICAVFPFLPNYPITLNLWLADDEFDASGRFLLNGSADHYLTIEDAVTAGSILLDALEPARL